MLTIKQLIVITIFLTLSTSIKFDWIKEHKNTETNKADFLSQYYCGFGDKFCGQSDDDDVASKCQDGLVVVVETNVFCRYEWLCEPGLTHSMWAVIRPVNAVNLFAELDWCLIKKLSSICVINVVKLARWMRWGPLPRHLIQEWTR